MAIVFLTQDSTNGVCEPSNSCQAWLHFQAWNVNGVPRDCDAIPAPVGFQVYTKLSAKDR